MYDGEVAGWWGSGGWRSELWESGTEDWECVRLNVGAVVDGGDTLGEVKPLDGVGVDGRDECFIALRSNGFWWLAMGQGKCYL